MKRNISLFVSVVFLSLVLVYPLGHFFNSLFFHEFGGGLDIGPDTFSVNVLIGFMSIPPFLASLLFGVFGKDKWRWLITLVLIAPSVVFVFWLNIHKVVPVVFFLAGLVISLIINFFKNRGGNSVSV